MSCVHKYRTESVRYRESDKERERERLCESECESE